MAINDPTTNLDPFTLVYNSVWDMLLAHPSFCASVKEKNRMRFTAEHTRDIDVFDHEILAADLPEVRILPASLQPHLDGDSDNSYFNMRLQIEMATGDQRIDRWLFPLMWETLRAMQTWTTYILTLKWNNKTFVTLARPIESIVFDTQSPIDLIRGIGGWTSIWAYEVQMHVNTIDLLNMEL